jgi:DNA polymerase IV
VGLLERAGTTAATRYRLVGVGLGNFTDADDPRVQPDLFAATAS